MLNSRCLRILSHSLAGLSLAVASASAAAWPTRQVRIVVPGAPGSPPDVAMRIVAAHMSGTLKEAIVIDNKVGAGGSVALQALQSSKDDHTFLMAITGTSAIAPMTFKSLASMDFARDLRPVVQLAQTPIMIVANPASGIGTLAEALKAGRDKPGETVFATPNQNTLANLTVRLIEQSSKLKFNVVPFSRTADSVAAVSSGDAKLFADGVSVTLPFVRTNRLKAIAVLSSTRLPGLEPYPLGNEAVPGLEAIGRFGLVTTRDTGDDAVNATMKAALSAMADKEVIAKLQDLAFYPLPANAADYKTELQKESRLWGQVIREAGIAAE